MDVDEYNRQYKYITENYSGYELNIKIHEFRIKNGYPKGYIPKNSKYKRMKIYSENNGFCYYCGKFLWPNNFDLEHKIPLAKGGNNEYDNLTISCRKCNLKKMVKTDKEFIEISMGNNKHGKNEEKYA